VIAFASPYFHGGLDGDLRTCQARLVDNYVQHGYAIAFIPVRGTADSGACMEMLGDAERADLDQAVTWLGTQPWSSGRIGMVGVSYDGSTPWEVAGEGNPYLKTIVPISGVNDVFHLMYRNGGNETRAPGVLNEAYYQYGFVDYNAVEGERDISRMITGANCPEAWEGLTAAEYSSVTGERDDFGYWNERNSRPLVEREYTGSILLVQGLQDWNVDPGHQYPWIETLEAKGLYVAHLLGQWGHAWPDSPTNNTSPFSYTRWDWADMLLDWFDYWLKGDTSVDLGPRAQVQDSTGAWRFETTWPPADGQDVTLYLSPDGSLASSAPAASTQMLVATPDGDPVNCPTCVVFSTAPMAEDLRITGLPELTLTATPSVAGGHLGARLFTDDLQYLNLAEQDGIVRRQRIGWGQADLRFPQGGEIAQPVTPGAPVEFTLTFQPMDAVVPAGESLHLMIDLGVYGDHLPSPGVSPLLIDVGASARLTFSTTSPSPGDFFGTL